MGSGGVAGGRPLACCCSGWWLCGPPWSSRSRPRTRRSKPGFKRETAMWAPTACQARHGGAGLPLGPRKKAMPAFGHPDSIVNSIGMRFMRIPAGDFLMGSRDSDVNAGSTGDEKPQHRVVISKPFYLGAHEVTRGQFGRFVEATGYQTDAEKDSKGGLGWIADRRAFLLQDPKYSWRNPGFQTNQRAPGCTRDVE